MATLVLIIGESGSGKSTSMRNLDPKDTFLINVQNKPLPFRGWKKSYIPVQNGTGNYFQTDDAKKILATLDYVSEKRKDIKNVVIDDFQYIMANEFMRRAKEKGFEKFTDIGKNAFDIIYLGAQLSRPDLIIYFLSHSDVDDAGTTRCKTIGKLLNDKVCVEGMFTIVLQAIVADGQYEFITQNNGHNTAKSPMEMFKTLTIPNDLSFVSKTISEYNQ